MPPKPIAPMPRVSQTCLRLSAPSSRSGLAPEGAARSAAQHHHREHGDHADEDEGGTPAEDLAQPGRDGHADQRGAGESQHHQADRAGPAVRRRQRRSHQRGDAEIGAVRQPTGEAQEIERQVAGRQRAGEVAQREHRHQGDQECAPAPAGGQHCEHRRPDHHAQRIGADHVAGLRNARADVTRHLGQEAHDDELAGADGEAADAERQHRAREARRRGGRRQIGCGHGNAVAN
jgi:hypothetical protein